MQLPVWFPVDLRWSTSTVWNGTSTVVLFEMISRQGAPRASQSFRVVIK